MKLFYKIMSAICFIICGFSLGMAYNGFTGVAEIVAMIISAIFGIFCYELSK